MENKTHPLPWPLLLVFLSAIAFCHSQASDSKSYIVYMGDPLKGDFSSSSLHTSMLEQVLGREITETTLQRSYGKSFNGFVAQLTDQEMQRVSEMEGVVSVFPNGKNQLDTTRSWDFMGFPQKVDRATTETDVIIGVIDSGIWPESDSFKDDGFGPPPAKWKGTCQTSANFTCNNKIVGARYYRSVGFSNDTDESDVASPRDTTGHGTHTASIAAGGVVTGASLYGLGMGTARGGVPGARIAVYKICWSDSCFDADILAAFDDAIADGVDIISLSVGFSGLSPPKNYFNDSIAIGSFHAMKNGILTSTSAGNTGPELGSTTKVAPWFLSVAASTTDRHFTTKIQLGNNKVYEGVSINTFEPRSTYRMIYAGDAPNITANVTSSVSRLCSAGSLNAALVRGKIVLCDTLGDGKAPFLAGAAGVVLRNGDFVDYANSYPLPAAFVFRDDGTDILNYVRTTRNATATIYKSNRVKSDSAPFIASFSSRGPNLIAGDIMKPDLAAPGAEILAAWSPVKSPTAVDEDGRSVRYNVVSGTSMACPHASGVAAYIKSFHPSWSPAALKSAMMTTALPMSVETSPEAEFAYGAGHINPIKALNPGLVYDAEEIDYVKFLCGQGYETKSLRLVTGDRSNCSDVATETVWDLNLPSFTLSAMPLRPFKQTFNRVVTNVGSASSTYNATIINTSSAVNVVVEPRTLTFKSLGEKLSFRVKVVGAIGRTTVSASLVWDDGTHQVRSPIVVYA